MSDDIGSPLGDPDPLRDVLAAAEPMTLEERRQIVRQAQVLIEHLFGAPSARARARRSTCRTDSGRSESRSTGGHTLDLRGFFTGELAACQRFQLGG